MLADADSGTRGRILTLLEHEPHTIRDLTRALNRSTESVRQHLGRALAAREVFVSVFGGTRALGSRGPAPSLYVRSTPENREAHGRSGAVRAVLASFEADMPPGAAHTVERLAGRHRLPVREVRAILDGLQAAGLVRNAGGLWVPRG